jgi:hypothetical protein
LQTGGLLNTGRRALEPTLLLELFARQDTVRVSALVFEKIIDLVVLQLGATTFTRVLVILVPPEQRPVMF